MSAPRIAVVGSLHYDIMVTAPDRPRKGETMFGTAWWPKCGGKGGNQAVEAARAGVHVEMIGAIGRDDFGDALLANLDRAEVGRRHVAILAGEPSGMSVALFDAGGDYAATVVSGANQKIDPASLTPELFRGISVVVLQNEIADAANLAAARAARVVGARVILNAAPARPTPTDLVPLIDILVVNAIEAEMLGSAPVTDINSATDAARDLHRQYPTVIVTAGGDGVAVATAGDRFAIPAKKIKVESTHGAGDCFVGVLAARLAAGMSLPAAVGDANAAAGLLVSTPEDKRIQNMGQRSA